MKFPRYRIGESLLPGTMSILCRLGVIDRVQAAGFTRKRAATFVWGGGRPPWTFNFSTPKTEPWVFDHALQVTRAEYDQILLDAAGERGAMVQERHEVTEVGLNGDGGPLPLPGRVPRRGEHRGRFRVDASGERGVLAKKLGLRRWDQYYRNMAVWSYWKGGKRFRGILEGNIFSATWKEGWIWIIPLKDDTYSVGVVTGTEANAASARLGHRRSTFRRCTVVRWRRRSWPRPNSLRRTGRRGLVVRSATVSSGTGLPQWRLGLLHRPAVLAGRAPGNLFGQLAAAAIDHLYDHPEDAAEVEDRYDRSYRAAYSHYQ